MQPTPKPSAREGTPGSHFGGSLARKMSQRMQGKASCSRATPNTPMNLFKQASRRVNRGAHAFRQYHRAGFNQGHQIAGLRIGRHESSRTSTNADAQVAVLLDEVQQMSAQTQRSHALDRHRHHRLREWMKLDHVSMCSLYQRLQLGGPLRGVVGWPRHPLVRLVCISYITYATGAKSWSRRNRLHLPTRSTGVGPCR